MALSPCAPYRTLEILQVTVSPTLKPLLYDLQDCWAYHRQLKPGAGPDGSKLESTDLEEVKLVLERCARVVEKIDDDNSSEEGIDESETEKMNPSYQKLVFIISDLKSFLEFTTNQQNKTKGDSSTTFSKFFGKTLDRRKETVVFSDPPKNTREVLKDLYDRLEKLENVSNTRPIHSV